MAAFSLTERQQARMAEVRALARDVLAPIAAAGRPGRVNRELVRALGEHGLIGALVPPILVLVNSNAPPPPPPPPA